MNQSFDIKPFNSPCGASVHGFDCSKGCSDYNIKKLNEALLDHCFLVFRNQKLAPDSLVKFSRKWGHLKKHILKQYLLDDFPEVLVVSNKKNIDGRSLGIEDAGRYWHSDVSYEEEPPMGSLLYCIENPPYGGDTLFANQYLALKLINKSIINDMHKLRAFHNFNYDMLQKKQGSKRKALSKEQKKQLNGAVHPIIRIHPETGKKCLYVNPGFTVGLDGNSSEEGKVLLNYLFSCATDQSVIHRHEWQLNDLVFWDNRCLMHRATPYGSSYLRHMFRTTIT